MTPETQAYLTETKAPAVTMAQVRNALRAFLGNIGLYQAELATQIRLLNDALVVEADPVMKQKLESEKQVLWALRREISELEAQARDVVPIGVQRVQSDSDLRTAAQPLGYTV